MPRRNYTTKYIVSDITLTKYPITFDFIASDIIRLTINGQRVDQALYSVDRATSECVISFAPALGDQLLISRDVSSAVLASFSPGGVISANSLNLLARRSSFKDEEVEDLVKRAILLPEDEDGSFVLPDVASRYNTVLGFDGSGRLYLVPQGSLGSGAGGGGGGGSPTITLSSGALLTGSHPNGVEVSLAGSNYVIRLAVASATGSGVVDGKAQEFSGLKTFKDSINVGVQNAVLMADGAGKVVALSGDPLRVLSSFFKGNYDAAAPYSRNDVVIYNNAFYYSTIDTNTTAPSNTASWTSMSGVGGGGALISHFKGDYSASASYSINDFVIYTSVGSPQESGLYRSLKDSNSDSPTIMLSWEKIARSSEFTDDEFLIKNKTDLTKKIKIDVSGVATGTTLSFNPAKVLDAINSLPITTYKQGETYELQQIVAYTDPSDTSVAGLYISLASTNSDLPTANTWAKITSSSGSTTFSSDQFALADNVDSTKELSFDLSSQVTGTKISINVESLNRLLTSPLVRVFVPGERYDLNAFVVSLNPSDPTRVRIYQSLKATNTDQLTNTVAWKLLKTMPSAIIDSDFSLTSDTDATKKASFSLSSLAPSQALSLDVLKINEVINDPNVRKYVSTKEYKLGDVVAFVDTTSSNRGGLFVSTKNTNADSPLVSASWSRVSASLQSTSFSDDTFVLVNKTDSTKTMRVSLAGLGSGESFILDPTKISPLIDNPVVSVYDSTKVYERNRLVVYSDALKPDIEGLYRSIKASNNAPITDKSAWSYIDFTSQITAFSDASFSLFDDADKTKKATFALDSISTGSSIALDALELSKYTSTPPIKIHSTRASYNIGDFVYFKSTTAPATTGIYRSLKNINSSPVIDTLSWKKIDDLDPSFNAGLFTLYDPTDSTKVVKFSLAGIATGTTVVLNTEMLSRTAPLSRFKPGGPYVQDECVLYLDPANPNNNGIYQSLTNLNISLPTVTSSWRLIAGTKTQGGGGGTAPVQITTFSDTSFALYDNTDNSKKITFDINNPSTGTTLNVNGLNMYRVSVSSFKGNFETGTTYSLNDVVINAGELFKSTKNGNASPTSDSLAWSSVGGATSSNVPAFSDDLFTLFNTTDNTKKLTFSLQDLATGEKLVVNGKDLASLVSSPPLKKYASTNAYSTSDLVVYRGNIYKAIRDVASAPAILSSADFRPMLETPGWVDATKSFTLQTPLAFSGDSAEIRFNQQVLVSVKNSGATDIARGTVVSFSSSSAGLPEIIPISHSEILDEPFGILYTTAKAGGGFALVMIRGTFYPYTPAGNEAGKTIYVRKGFPVGGLSTVPPVNEESCYLVGKCFGDSILVDCKKVLNYQYVSQSLQSSISTRPFYLTDVAIPGKTRLAVNSFPEKGPVVSINNITIQVGSFVPGLASWEKELDYPEDSVVVQGSCIGSVIISSDSSTDLAVSVRLEIYLATPGGASADSTIIDATNVGATTNGSQGKIPLLVTDSQRVVLSEGYQPHQVKLSCEITEEIIIPKNTNLVFVLLFKGDTAGSLIYYLGQSSAPQVHIPFALSLSSLQDVKLGATLATGDALVFKNGKFTNSPIASGGGVSLGPVDSVSNDKGASITAGALSLAPADATNPGIVTTGAQEFGGEKTFSSIKFTSIKTPTYSSGPHPALGRYNMISLGVDSDGVIKQYESFLKVWNMKATTPQPHVSFFTGRYLVLDAEGSSPIKLPIAQLAFSTTVPVHGPNPQRVWTDVVPHLIHKILIQNIIVTHGSFGTLASIFSHIEKVNPPSLSLYYGGAKIGSSFLYLKNSCVDARYDGCPCTIFLEYAYSDYAIAPPTGLPPYNEDVPELGGGGQTISVGDLSATPNDKGIEFNSGAISLAPADPAHPGVVTITDQAFAGTKEFSGLRIPSIKTTQSAGSLINPNDMTIVGVDNTGVIKQFSTTVNAWNIKLSSSSARYSTPTGYKVLNENDASKSSASDEASIYLFGNMPTAGSVESIWSDPSPYYIRAMLKIDISIKTKAQGVNATTSNYEERINPDFVSVKYVSKKTGPSSIIVQNDAPDARYDGCEFTACVKYLHSSSRSMTPSTLPDWEDEDQVAPQKFANDLVKNGDPVISFFTVNGYVVCHQMIAGDTAPSASISQTNGTATVTPKTTAIGYTSTVTLPIAKTLIGTSTTIKAPSGRFWHAESKSAVFAELDATTGVLGYGIYDDKLGSIHAPTSEGGKTQKTFTESGEALNNRPFVMIVTYITDIKFKDLPRSVRSTRPHIIDVGASSTCDLPFAISGEGNGVAVVSKTEPIFSRTVPSGSTSITLPPQNGIPITGTTQGSIELEPSTKLKRILGIYGGATNFPKSRAVHCGVGAYRASITTFDPPAVGSSTPTNPRPSLDAFSFYGMETKSISVSHLEKMHPYSFDFWAHPGKANFIAIGSVVDRPITSGAQAMNNFDEFPTNVIPFTVLGKKPRLVNIGYGNAQIIKSISVPASITIGAQPVFFSICPLVSKLTGASYGDEANYSLNNGSPLVMSTCIDATTSQIRIAISDWDNTNGSSSMAIMVLDGA